MNRTRRDGRAEARSGSVTAEGNTPALVLRWRRAFNVALRHGLLAAAVMSCSSSSGPGSSIATIEITPSSVTRQVGETVQLSVALKDASGGLVSGQITWSSSNQAVATVSTSGLVTANTLGGATISAMAGGKTGTAQVTVAAPPVVSIVVTPENGTLFVSETAQLNVEMKDGSGNVVTDRSPNWTSSSPSVATVNNGLVTAVSEGITNITATIDGKSDFAVVTVLGPCSLVLAPAIAVGETANGTLESGDCVLEIDTQQGVQQYYVDGFSLMVTEATSVQIDQLSGDFDTYLELWELVNSTSVTLRAFSDDLSEDDTNSRILFTLQPGAEYIVLASSFSELETGAYSVTVTAVPPDVLRPATGVLKRSPAVRAAVRPNRR